MLRSEATGSRPVGTTGHFPTSAWRLTAVFAVGAALVTASDLVRGDVTWLWLPLAELAAALAILLLSRWKVVRLGTRVVTVAFAVALPLLLIVVRAGGANGLHLYSGARTGLWYGDPNALAGSMVVAATVAVLALEPVRWPTLALFALSGLSSAAILVRSATVGAVLSAATWWWTRFRGGQRFRVALWGLALLVAAAAYLALYDPPGPRGPFLQGYVIQRFSPAGALGITGSGGLAPRLHAQRVAVGFFLRHPIAGLGYGGFADAWRATVEPGTTHPISSAHNLRLQLLAEGGLLGFLGWAVPIGAVLWWARRRLVFLAPLLVVVAWLNLIELGFFWSGAFYGTWAAFGWALWEKPTFDRAISHDQA